MAIYKNKKNSTWLFRVYVLENNVRKQKCRSGFPTKKIAKEEEQKFLRSYNLSNDLKINSDLDNLKFQDLFLEYQKTKKLNLKFQSYRTIMNRFYNHILPYFKNYYLKDITYRVYNDWKLKILEQNFSYKYNSSLHGCMVNILNYAMNYFDLDYNIAKKVGNFSRKNYMPKVDFWTYDEFQKFISVVDDREYYILFYTLFNTGMRLGECLALNWSDLKGNCLRINKTLSKEKKDGSYVCTTPKTISSIRTIAIDDNTKILLEELKKEYSCYENFSDEWYIFGGLCALSQTTIGRRKNQYCQKANVKKIRIHDFRHSHATILLSKGLPVTVISKRLGHSDIAMTLNVYSHYIQNDENRVIEVINSLNMNRK